MSRPIPPHFSYDSDDDEHLDDTPPDDFDEVVYVSKATGHLITHREPRQNRQRRDERH